MIKADTTAENRPAYLIISRNQDIVFRATYEYQSCVEVVVVLLVKITIVFVRLFSKLLMESRAWILFLLRGGRFQSGCHGLAQPVQIVSCDWCQRACPQRTYSCFSS